VQPIAIYSERDLAREVAALAEHLNANGHRDEWTCRLAAVRKLQGLVLGGAAELDSFAPQLRTLVKGLCSSASDLRSSLVKESCALFELLARTLREAFEPFAETFVPVLLKNTYVTIQVISQTSNACIRSIIFHVVPLKCLPKLVAGMTDKNSTVRSRSVEYAQLLLTHVPAVPEGERCPLERYADALTTALKMTLADALADARAGARSCFWTLNAHFPSRCAKLLASLDANTHRYTPHYNPPGNPHHTP
jgi:CLIP-associating protein 1/2